MRREWDLEELIKCWTLDEGEFELVGNKSGATRLGFSLMLKFFELEARFPRQEEEEEEEERAEGGSGLRGRPGEGGSRPVR